MKTELYNYDIYPKVVPAGRPIEITIRPLGLQSAFSESNSVRISSLQERVYPLDETPRQHAEYILSPCTDGCLRFTHAFTGEQEHFILINEDTENKIRLSVYSLEDDLVGKLPLMGDLHLHTIRSDGRQDPPIVAAHLRQQGYDFIAITDHENYSGSLESIDAYREVPIEMNLMTGEEVHLPDCHLHCVHVGGRYSINALVDKSRARLFERGNASTVSAHPEAWTQQEGSDFPGTMTNEAFHEVIRAYADTLKIPDGIPKFVYAGFCWECEQIRKAGGLAIFPHPYWIHDNAYHGDERLTQHLFDTHPFDAFEVLGGENYFEQNGHQTVHYYEAKAKGISLNVVGSSDSHSSVNNRNAFIAETICFAEENTPEGVMEAIRAGRSVALDTISTEFRLAGDFRLVKYACFLMNEYFPLHQAACCEQGRAMKEYYCGDREDGRALLELTQNRIAKLWKKYFAF